MQWKDGSTNWIQLKDVKHSYPVQLAEYAIANHISLEPAFVWWVQDVLKHWNRIISKVKSKYWMKTHKYGIQIPKTVKQALEFDEIEGNALWREAIANEMKNV